MFYVIISFKPLRKLNLHYYYCIEYNNYSEISFLNLCIQYVSSNKIIKRTFLGDQHMYEFKEIID